MANPLVFLPENSGRMWPGELPSMGLPHRVGHALPLSSSVISAIANSVFLNSSVLKCK